MDLTLLAINVGLLKTAQLQQELSLKLIKTSMESLQEPAVRQNVSSAVQSVEPSPAGEQVEGGTIDIRA